MKYRLYGKIKKREYRLFRSRIGYVKCRNDNGDIKEYSENLFRISY